MNLAVIRIIGTILFLYLMWRNLKDDYKEEDLISYTWMVLLAFLVGGRVIFGLVNWGVWNDNWIDWFSVWSKPGLNYLGGYLTMIGATLWVSNKNGWKLWSFAEDSINNLLLFFGLLFVDEFFRTRFNIEVGLYALTLFLGVGLSSWIKTKYRSLVWYKSGKKGFGFFFMNFIICLVFAAINFFYKDRWIYSILYLIGSLISVIGLFILGEVFGQLLINIRRKKNDR